MRGRLPPALPAVLLGPVLLGTALLGTPPARAAGAEVTIDNFTFSPAELVVTRGTTVIFTNRDDIPHTIVDRADPRRMRSSALDTGDSFRFTFAVPGAYGYFCSLHPHMQGRVVVR